jgi:FAD/FMN-containing dehydrogenase
MNELLKQLAGRLEGELYFDTTMRTLYATDASAYREIPLAVAIPKSIDDLKTLIKLPANIIHLYFRVQQALHWQDR